MSLLDRLFPPMPNTMIRVNDSCPCGADFTGMGASAGINHRYWMEAHAVCRAKAKAASKSHSEASDG